MPPQIIKNTTLLLATGAATLLGAYFAASVLSAPHPPAQTTANDGNTLPELAIIAPTQPATRPRILDPQGNIIIYASPLSTEPGEEWSDNTITTTPRDHRRYLGDFTVEPVTLSLPSLPPHKLLRITFDLLIMRSWFGSNLAQRESYWDLSLDGGPNLIHTTFANPVTPNQIITQSFPDSSPSASHPAWTGAAERQTLGITQNVGVGGLEQTYDLSSVYHLSLTFPHQTDHITFRFLGTPTGPDKNKPWGLANVQVVAIADLAPPSQPQLAAMWADLGSSDPITAFKAHWNLVAAGDAAVAYLQTHITETLSATAAAVDIDALVRDLYSHDEAKITAAIATIGALGPAARGPIAQALVDPNLDPKVQARLRPLLNQLSRAPANQNPTELRLQRARHLLQVIHTPQALALVKRINPVFGDPGTYTPPIAPGR